MASVVQRYLGDPTTVGNVVFMAIGGISSTTPVPDGSGWTLLFTQGDPELVALWIFARLETTSNGPADFGFTAAGDADTGYQITEVEGLDFDAISDSISDAANSSGEFPALDISDAPPGSLGLLWMVSNAGAGGSPDLFDWVDSHTLSASAFPAVQYVNDLTSADKVQSGGGVGSGLILSVAAAFTTIPVMPAPKGVYQGRVRYTNGQSAGGDTASCSVELKEAGTATAVSAIFADRAGTTTIDNPMLTDADGFFVMYADEGVYDAWFYVGESNPPKILKNVVVMADYTPAYSGTLAVWQDTLRSTDGTPFAGGTVTVRTSDGDIAADLFSDLDGTPTTNPVIADEHGTAKFYVAPGRYTIYPSSADTTMGQTLYDVVLIDDLTAPPPVPRTWMYNSSSQSEATNDSETFWDGIGSLYGYDAGGDIIMDMIVDSTTLPHGGPTTHYFIGVMMARSDVVAQQFTLQLDGYAERDYIATIAATDIEGEATLDSVDATWIFDAGNNVTTWVWDLEATALPAWQETTTPKGFDITTNEQSLPSWLFVGGINNFYLRAYRTHDLLAVNLGSSSGPASECRAVAFSPQTVSSSGYVMSIMATVETSSPYLKFYQVALGSGGLGIANYGASVSVSSPTGFAGIAWHPSGQLVAVNSNGVHFFQVDLAESETVTDLGQTLSGTTDTRGMSAFSPDGTMYAVGTNDGDKLAVYTIVTLLDPSTWTKRTIATGSEPSQLAFGVAFSPDSSEIAIQCSATPFLHRYDTATLTKKTDPATLVNNTSGNTSKANWMAYSPDGAYLAVLSMQFTTSGIVTIYDTSDMSVAGTLSPSSGQANGVAWHDDGSIIAICISVSPYVKEYDTGTWSARTAPSSLPAGNRKCIAYARV